MWGSGSGSSGGVGVAWTTSFAFSCSTVDEGNGKGLSVDAAPAFPSLLDEESGVDAFSGELDGVTDGS